VSAPLGQLVPTGEERHGTPHRPQFVDLYPQSDFVEGYVFKETHSTAGKAGRIM
jgi:hypothetical protein